MTQESTCVTSYHRPGFASSLLPLIYAFRKASKFDRPFESSSKALFGEPAILSTHWEGRSAFRKGRYTARILTRAMEWIAFASNPGKGFWRFLRRPPHLAVLVGSGRVNFGLYLFAHCCAELADQVELQDGWRRSRRLQGFDNESNPSARVDKGCHGEGNPFHQLPQSHEGLCRAGYDLLISTLHPKS